MDNKYQVNNNFFGKYNPQIRAIVAKILNNAGQSHEIDDCVNDVYLKLMEKLHQYNEIRGSMAAFVAIVARSTALNYCRSNVCKTDELIGDEKLGFLNNSIDVEDEVMFILIRDNILKNLNDNESYLFTKKILLYYSSEEIAKELKITRSAVDNRLNRLKNKIKKLLIKGGIKS